MIFIEETISPAYERRDNANKNLGVNRGIELDPRRIDWKEEAVEMIKKHQNHEGRIKVKTKSGIKTLTGFRVSKELIAPLLESDEITELFIIPAVIQEDRNNALFTTVIAGIDADNQLRTEHVFDHCRPCPENCPELESMQDLVETIEERG